MALVQAVGYCNGGDNSTTGYWAIAKWAANTAYTAGQLIRQNATPTVTQERVFVCIVAGTSHATTEPTWTITRGAKTTDNTVTWQECTGWPALNGDLTNTLTWSQLTGNAAFAVTLGQVIQRNNGASIWICSTAGTSGASEPAWANNTAGTTRTDGVGTLVWTCLGASFTAGSAPHARLQNACATNWYLAGATVYIAAIHNESQTAQISIAPAVSATAIGKIISFDSTGAWPPTTVSAGATISTTSTTAVVMSLSGPGALYFYGVTLKAGVGQSGAGTNITLTLNSGTIILDTCSLQIAGTASSSVINIAQGSSGTQVWVNTTVKFADVGQRLSLSDGFFTWKKTGTILVTGSSVPTNLMFFTTNTITAVLEAIDLSQLTGNLMGNTSIFTPGTLTVKDCKLNGSMTITGFGYKNQYIQFLNSDSSGTAYKSSRYTYEGTETTETTITRVGGATDPTGQQQSRKIVTNAATTVEWVTPFLAEPMAIWSNTTASPPTITVCGTWNSASLPNKDDIWLEIEYLGTASFPLGVVEDTTKANILAASVACASDSSTWNGGGSGAGWSPFKLTKVLANNIAFAGLVHVRVRVAKASSTFYIDPKVVIT